MIFYSLETRWFLSGKLPDAVLSWFTTSKNIHQTEERRDYYLYQPDITQTGIKMREGQAEYKVLVDDFGTFQTEHCAGQLQYFKKWSFDLQRTQETLSGTLRDHTEWVPVDKKRWLRDIEYEKSRCSLELSELQIAGRTCWSICFEQTVEKRPHPEKLKKLVNAELVSVPFNNLQLSNAMNYPEQITKVFDND